MSPLAQRTSTSTKAAPPAPPKPTRVSMNPDDFQLGGGGINDIDVTITDTQTATFDWGGQAALDTPALAIEFTDENGGTHQEYLSLGTAADWAPDEAGEGFVSLSGKTSIVESTNLGRFLKSLTDLDFPKELLADGNLKNLIGTKVHVKREVVERTGLIRTGKNAQKPSTVLLVTKLYSLPEAESSVPTKAAPKSAVGKPAASVSTAPKPNGKASPVAGDDLDGSIVTALQLHLAETDAAIPAKDIAKVVFKYFKDNAMDALANKAVARSSKQDFRSALNESGFVYDGSTLGLATE